MPNLLHKWMLFFQVGFGFSVFIALIEVFRSANTIQNIFHVKGSVFLFVFLLLAVIFRSRGFFFVFERQSKVFLWLGSCLFSLAIIFFCIEVMTYPNFIFAHTHINIPEFFYCALMVFLIALSQQKNKFFIKNARVLIFITPLLIFTIFKIMSMLPKMTLNPVYLFDFIMKEDSVVETLQTIFLLVSMYAAFLLVKKNILQKKVALAMLYLCMTLGFFFVAGEEISWGQRIFHIATPKSFQQANVQHELTLHNLAAVHYEAQLVTATAALWGFAGIFMTWEWSKSKKKKFQLFFPRHELFFYFFLPFLYNAYVVFFRHDNPVWAEVFEFLLYSGVAIHMLQQLQKSPRK